MPLPNGRVARTRKPPPTAVPTLELAAVERDPLAHPDESVAVLAAPHGPARRPDLELDASP